jgi:hypothetical protein
MKKFVVLNVLIILSLFITDDLYANDLIIHNLDTVGISEPERIAAKYFECLFVTRDFATMKKIMAKDAVYNQAEGLPYGGTYIGFDELVKMFQKAGGYFDLQIEKNPVYYTNPATNGVFIYFWIKCKSKKSGKEISMPISEYYEVNNGLITHIRPYYFDTKSFSAFLE